MGRRFKEEGLLSLEQSSRVPPSSGPTWPLPLSLPTYLAGFAASPGVLISPLGASRVSP
jgi:hypothetical protein